MCVAFLQADLPELLGGSCLVGWLVGSCSSVCLLQNVKFTGQLQINDCTRTVIIVNNRKMTDV